MELAVLLSGFPVNLKTMQDMMGGDRTKAYPP
jgi:hypothetical protein